MPNALGLRRLTARASAFAISTTAAGYVGARFEISDRPAEFTVRVPAEARAIVRIAIVEDEAPARDRLTAAIRKAAPDARIVAELAAVSEAVEWLQANPAPDLLFLDIQLGDGVSFDILRRTRIACPVIFATAFDEYLIDAFQCNGIDYLLKPIPDERVAAAIAKYRGLKRHFQVEALLDSLDRKPPAYRDRILVRKGGDLTAFDGPTSLTSILR